MFTPLEKPLEFYEEMFPALTQQFARLLMIEPNEVRTLNVRTGEGKLWA
jgi:hypothetical protein